MNYVTKLVKVNGLQFAFLDLKDTNTFNYAVVFKQGANLERTLNRLEKKNKYYGISHLIEHLSFKGCKDYSTEEIKKLTKELGNSNAYTGYDKICYYMVSTNDYYEKIIDIVNNIAFNDLSNLTVKEIKTEKDIVISEAKLSTDNPQGLYSILATSKAFGIDSNDNVLGDPKTIKKLTFEDLIKVKKIHNNKNNIRIEIVYDSSKNSIENLIDMMSKSLDKFELGSDTKYDQEYLKDIPELDYKIKEINISEVESYPQYMVNIYLNIDKKYKNIIVDSVLDYINYHSPVGLFEQIREKNGLCYSIDAYTTKQFNQNTYSIYTEIDKNNLEKLKKGIVKSISEVKKNFNKEKFESYFKTRVIQHEMGLLNLNMITQAFKNILDENIYDENKEQLEKEGVNNFLYDYYKKNFTYDVMLNILEDISKIIESQDFILIKNDKEKEK